MLRDNACLLPCAVSTAKSCTMTRQLKSSDLRSSKGNKQIISDFLQPVAPTRNLTDEIVQRLADEISKGRLTPGTRLPTEAAMMQSMGVSRTVIREAIAQLKAQGYVTTRQGSGAFIANDVRRRGFQIDPSALSSIKRVVDILELRMAIEIEAAALACERATKQDIAEISAAAQNFDLAVSRGGLAVAEDFAFHRAIAQATGNSQYVEILGFLGMVVIPRQTVRDSNFTPARQSAYLASIRQEHGAIVEAICQRDTKAARATMRIHLNGAANRYRKLADPKAAPSVTRKS
jgi:GntR family transcriptional regulator, transcriptional repressor for pyruvate dehydrogenase complex